MVGPEETRQLAHAAEVRAKFMPSAQELHEMRVAESSRRHQRIKRQQADEMEARQYERPGRSIIRQVAEKHKVSAKEIIGRTRRKPVVRARQEAMYRISTELNYSLNHVADLLNRADHTTVIHGLRAHQERMAIL